MKRFFSIFLCMILLLTHVQVPIAYAAEPWPTGVSIAADGGILMDANSGTILYGKNIHETYFPASITKVLTALVVLKHCELEDVVTFTHSAVNTLEPGSSILGARVDDRMTVRDCLYALLLQSANEVANALAEHCSGSVEAFAELMNREAKALGCVDSNFKNPSGLNDPEHYVSAHDMALITQAAFEHPTFVEIDSTLYYDVPAGQLKQYPDGWRYYAHHRMMKRNDSNYYDGIIGGKTGYTSLAGNTLVTCAERDGLKLIAVVLNGHQTHYSDTTVLFDFGFENFRSVPVTEMDSSYGTVEQDLSIGGIYPGETVKLTIQKDSRITLPIHSDFSDVTSALDYHLDGTAPDTAVARIDYQYGDRTVGQAYLEAITIPGYTAPLTAAPEVSDSASDHAESQIDASLPETEEIPANEESLPLPSNDENTPEQKQEANSSSILSILKIILIAAASLGILGAGIFGFLAYRAKKEEEARLRRRRIREQRRKDWDSSTELNLAIQEHMRSRNQFKKRSLADKMRSWFSR